MPRLIILIISKLPLRGRPSLSFILVILILVILILVIPILVVPIAIS
jgi:hypothetical protein